MPTQTASPYVMPVSVAQLRAGDRVSIAEGFEPHIVATAEYSPVGGCVAFCIGLAAEDGTVQYIPTPGWGRSFPGHYGWSKNFYMTAEDAVVARARVSLFQEVYPDAP